MLNEKVSEQKRLCDKGGPHDKVALTAVTNYKLLPQQPQKTLICLSLFFSAKNTSGGKFYKFFFKKFKISEAFSTQYPSVRVK